MPLFSVVTPSFNQAQYLEQTLRSVLRQDYPEIEYLVADGASTDGSAEIIRRYSNKLAWWVSEKDGGQAEAVNKGFRRARGEYLGWLNSDDLYLPGALSAAVKAFEEHPEAGLVFGDVLSIDGAGKPFNVMTFGPRGLDELLCFQIISQPGVFLRRSLLEQTGLLDESYYYLLDHHLWIRYARAAETFYLPQRLAAARFHEGAKNVAQGAAFGREAFRIVAWAAGEPSLAGHARTLKHKMRAGAHRFDAHYLLDNGQPKAALAAYWKTFVQHPPTALKEWRRIGYALAGLVADPSRLREGYTKAREQKLGLYGILDEEDPHD